MMKVRPVVKEKVTKKPDAINQDNCIVLNTMSGRKNIDKSLLIDLFFRVSSETWPSKSSAEKCCYELGVSLSISNIRNILKFLKVENTPTFIISITRAQTYNLFVIEAFLEYFHGASIGRRRKFINCE